MAPSIWALQTRSWRQTGVAREDRQNQIDKPSIAYWRDHSARRTGRNSAATGLSAKAARSTQSTKTVERDALAHRFAPRDRAAPDRHIWRPGASRRRVTPMPRGNRPLTAACTSLGARNASEIVILTCRMLQLSPCSNLLDTFHGASNDLIKPTPATRWMRQV